MKYKSLKDFESSLGEKDKELFVHARNGEVEEALKQKWEKLTEKERQDLVRKHTSPLLLDEKLLAFNPKERDNQFACFLMDIYGKNLGLILMSTLLFSKNEKDGNRYLLDSINFIQRVFDHPAQKSNDQ